MTLEDYQLYKFIEPKKPETEKPVYVGSGEDVCLETLRQLTSREERCEEVSHN